MQDKEKRETLTDLVIELKHYYECQKQHKMYLVAEQTTHVISSLAIAMVMAVLLLTIFAFLGMAAAHWLSTLFGSLAMGFLFYALFLACVLGIFYMNRRRWIILPIARMMIHVFIKDGHSTVSPQGKVYDGHPTDTTKGKEADDDPE